MRTHDEKGAIQMILHPCVEAAVAHMSDETFAQIVACVRLSEEVATLERWITSGDDSPGGSAVLDGKMIQLFEREGVSGYALDDCFGQPFVDALLQARKRAKAHVA